MLFYHCSPQSFISHLPIKMQLFWGLQPFSYTNKKMEARRGEAAFIGPKWPLVELTLHIHPALSLILGSQLPGGGGGAPTPWEPHTILVLVSSAFFISRSWAQLFRKIICTGLKAKEIIPFCLPFVINVANGIYFVQGCVHMHLSKYSSLSGFKYLEEWLTNLVKHPRGH